jgi:hypothetical protein
MFNGKIHFKWPFSIATLNYQRVARLLPPDLRPEGWVPDDVKAILSPKNGLTIIIDGPLLAIKLPQRHDVMAQYGTGFC